MGKDRPYINYFQQTISQRYKNRITLKMIPKSRRYRNELEILLGAVVIIKCYSWKLFKSEVDGQDCYKILLIKSDVVKAPTGRNASLPIHIGHIWTIIDKDWKNRNKLYDGCYLECKGFIYEYESHEKRNIGLQCLSLRVKDKNDDI